MLHELAVWVITASQLLSDDPIAELTTVDFSPSSGQEVLTVSFRCSFHSFDLCFWLLRLRLLKCALHRLHFKPILKLNTLKNKTDLLLSKHTTLVFSDVHWALVGYWVQLKVLVLIYNALNGLGSI